MVRNDTWLESDDGTRLSLIRWSPSDPEGKPAAILHIIHGMAEHAQRYERLAAKFAQVGIETWAADQRGHGKTANPDINKPGRGGLLGHCADNDGFLRVTRDIHIINSEIIRLRPGVPVFLLGHSWGSFIAQSYIEEHSSGLAGCILSGTRGPDGFKVRAGVPAMTALAFFCGQRKGSKIAKAMADGSYNNSFKPNRTEFDWLSRDEKEVDAYVRDPLCGFLCSSGFYRDLARGLFRIHQPRALAGINPNLPVYIFSGNADPVGDMGASPTALVNAYRSLGLCDLEFVLYPGARHEPFNEINREEVTDNLLSWILKRCGNFNED
ncbi:MAG: lysophospholipase [Treponema sp.]|nr:lysophospholipase [Treponema sp.]